MMASTKCAVYLIGMSPALRTKPEVGGGGRYYMQRRLARAAKKLGIAELAVTLPLPYPTPHPSGRGRQVLHAAAAGARGQEAGHRGAGGDPTLTSPYPLP